MTTKDDGLLDVGVHCFACNRLDFLPFVCDYCHHEFCGEHRKVDAHNCSSYDPHEAPVKPIHKPVNKLGSAPAPNAWNQRHVQRTTPKPQVVNRTPVSTSTSTYSASKNPTAKESALAKLKAMFPSSSSSKSSTMAPKKPLSSSAMLKLKKDAKGDERVAQENRVYFYISRPASASRPEAVLPVFYNKNLSVGKLLDLVCEQLDVTIKNKFGADRPKLYLNDDPLAVGQKLFQIKELKTVSTLASSPVTITVK